MADSDLATRAPENDAQPSSPSSTTTNPSTTTIIPGDTPAQSGPTMGEHCTTDRPLPTNTNHTTPKGETSSINGIQCYITKPTEYPHNPCKMLLLLTGGTGIHSVNNQLQADMYAEKGYVVVMPDQFSGDAAPNAAKTTTAVSVSSATEEGEQESSSPTASSAGPSFLERLKLGAAETAKSFLIDMWLARHTPSKVMPILRKTLEGAREEFADAVANGGGIYGVGYCFGAKYILLLSGLHDGSSKKATAGDEEQSEAAEGPEIKAGAIAHGTDITREDIENVKSPLVMACVENDSLFPDEVRERGREALQNNSVEHKVEVFSGVPHGFAVLGDYADESIKEKQKEAFDMMLGWLDAH